ncbi:DJ-1/PfpI family protein [Candidatus Poribacteria bacterium]|jgi:transcriptional regulator GlxA family with amidase domain|nr:DJ-1/PfpI family protein [Candidatus Poribacteria bacterium]MBT5532628.1 DJ-1/PfpI family protein [Candidatus Poribacteria bacterium]MBT5712374.1 DJ-1/PfpI family protein [Candidatus Poribacteria bacterium]MBT7096384.1 DJ-1/PfpI family protein [Candidatus Poribacteria bacterium]MBT7807481.1 DJ-1/PfpI family protein [Candidatus Poribacteria bacterium]
MTRTVGILIFDGVEILDFCGPYEVFSVAGGTAENDDLTVYTVAESRVATRAANGLVVHPDYAFDDCPDTHLLVLPGGRGTRDVIQNEAAMSWIRQACESAELVLSVCTGALLLGKLGLLDGLDATTHHGAFAELRRVAPNANIREGERYLDNGKFVVAAGVAAGIDASFHVVARLFGEETATRTARHIEYPWERESTHTAPA